MKVNKWFYNHVQNRQRSRNTQNMRVDGCLYTQM